MSSFALCSLTESADQAFIPELGSLEPRKRPKKTMAAPDNVTTLALSGRFQLDKAHSDDTDELLRLQGVSWLTRKFIAGATITLQVKHYKDDDSVEHIDIKQTLRNFTTRETQENRVLDWEERKHSDDVFGAVIGKSRRVTNVKGKLDEDILKNGWTEDTYRDGVVQSYVKSDTPEGGKPWIVNQTWGFEIIDGLRKYSRHLKFTGPNHEDLELRLRYDYLGA